MRLPLEVRHENEIYDADDLRVTKIYHSEFLWADDVRHAKEFVEAVNAQEWQPINSAPKDGTEILGWQKNFGVLLIRWITANDTFSEAELEDRDYSSEDAAISGWFCADFVAGMRLDGDAAPTLWQPLPAPPTT